MEQINRITLRGTIGSCRRQKFNDRNVVNFTMITSFAFKDKDGTAVIEDMWHNVTAWESRNIQDLEKLDKGTKVNVEGRLRVRLYINANGEERQITEVVASKLNIINNEEQLCYEM